ncbi:MAG: hypothetical protein ABIJ56_01780 [Pseudomonadota bacterium]
MVSSKAMDSLRRAAGGFRLIKLTAAALGVTLIATVGFGLLARDRGAMALINWVRVLAPSALLILAALYSAGLVGVARGVPPGSGARLPAWLAFVFSLPQLAGRGVSLWFQLYLILAHNIVHAGDKDRIAWIMFKTGDICTLVSLLLFLWTGRHLTLFLGETVLARKALMAAAALALLGSAVIYALGWEIPDDTSRFYLQLFFVSCMGFGLLIIAGIGARAFERAIDREIRDFRD